jgi:hypothetical protein
MIVRLLLLLPLELIIVLSAALLAVVDVAAGS